MHDALHVSREGSEVGMAVTSVSGSKPNSSFRTLSLLVWIGYERHACIIRNLVSFASHEQHCYMHIKYSSCEQQQYRRAKRWKESEY
jgi:hypothetical protein